MLPFLAVLLIAQGAVAAPSVGVNAYTVDQYPLVPDNGRTVNSYLVNGAAAWLDLAAKPFYATMLMATLEDMSNTNDASSQAEAVLGTIAFLGELVPGIAGDSCESAALINAYAYSVNAVDKSGLQQAVANYVSRVSTYIDLITQLLVNPNSVKFTTGPRGTCLGGGRTYSFEEAWNAILDNSNPYQIGYFNEVYCVSRRMYNAFGLASNNLAAAVTAVSIPQYNQIGRACLPDLANFLRNVATGANPSQAGASAKTCIAQAVAQVSY